MGNSTVLFATSQGTVEFETTGGAVFFPLCSGASYIGAMLIWLKSIDLPVIDAKIHLGNCISVQVWP